MRSIVISFVSMSIMDCPSPREGLNPLVPLTFSRVPGLNALNGIETGSPGGRQSITVAPIMSAGFWTVSNGSSPTASDITRTGRESRCDCLADLGVTHRPVSGGDAGSPVVLRGVGKRARSLAM